MTKLIISVLVLVLIAHYDHLAFCKESSEEENHIPKDAVKCPGGYCVQPHLCRNGTIIQDGEGLIAPRAGDDDPCEDFLQKCCAISEITLIKATAESSEEITEPGPSCGTNFPEENANPAQNQGFAKFAEFPWMAALAQRTQILDKQTIQYFCGGSLIHPQVILTAAHCVQNYTGVRDSIVVRLGEWNMETDNEKLKHVDEDVREIITHEEYVDQKFHNDVALLILKNPVKISKHIRPICLPNVDDSFDNQRCVLSGWGTANIHSTSFSNQLIKIDFPIVPREKCKQQFKATVLGSFFRLHKSFMCAGGEAGVDACKGYGGSPLVCKQKDAFVQTGIVSWGIGCGEENIPGAYVKVSKFVGWINDKLQTIGI